jgi:hypothetical protein
MGWAMDKGTGQALPEKQAMFEGNSWRSSLLNVAKR